jgi:hypothetical protein
MIKLIQIEHSQISLNNILCIGNIFGYCYHLVYEISYGLAQSDPIKRRPLYQKQNLNCLILACLALSEKIDKLGLTLTVKYDEETEPISHFIIQLTTEERR